MKHLVTDIDAPFWNFSYGIENIEKDRKMISEQIFKNLDVLVLPTLKSSVP